MLVVIALHKVTLVAFCRIRIFTNEIDKIYKLD